MWKKVALGVVLAAALVAGIKLAFGSPVFDLGPYVGVVVVALVASVSIDGTPRRWSWVWLCGLLLLAAVLYMNGRSEGAEGALIFASGILAAMIAAWCMPGRQSVSAARTS